MRTPLRPSRFGPLQLVASLSGGAGGRPRPAYAAPAALMTGAMSLHFFGYECARAASLSLLRGAGTTFSDASVATMQGLAAPMASLMLLIYTLLLSRFGPRRTLSFFGLGSGGILAVCAFFSNALPEGLWRNGAVVALFLAREGYVHLLATQYWAFLNSVMPVKAAASWFPRIAGVVCTVSAIAGLVVKPLSAGLGSIHQLVFVTSATLVLATIASNEAYRRAPPDTEFAIRRARDSKESKKQAVRAEVAGQADAASMDPAASPGGLGKASEDAVKPPSIFTVAREMFRGNRMLRGLLLETLACQSLSAMLSLAFHSASRQTLASAAEHAAYVGRFYACVNVASACLQFVIMPMLLTLMSGKDAPTDGSEEVKQAARLLLLGPLLSIVLLAFTSQHPSLALIALAFGFQKTIEYSVRSSATELLYVPMDQNSKFLGKEIISVVGTRGGRSISSLALTSLCTVMQPTSAAYAGIMTGVAGVWAFCARFAQREAATVALAASEAAGGKVKEKNT